MKTPREIILERHRAAEEKLNAISAEELASVSRASAEVQTRSNITALFHDVIEGFWHQAIWPWRRVWAGLAAIWIGILALHLASGELPHSSRAEMAETRNPQVLSALREQNKLMVQLLDPPAAPAPEPPNHSGPRSEQRRELFIA
jgi:hypothetical protein